MKRKNLFILSLAAMTMFSPNVSAQKWLEKALKKVDSTLDQVDKALNVPAQSAAPQSTTTGSGDATIIKNFISDVDFILESCIFDGKMLIIKFVLNNHGKDLQINYLASPKDGYTSIATAKVYDSQGNAYDFAYIAVGTEFAEVNRAGNGVSFSLPAGVKLRGSFGISKFNRNASALQSFIMSGAILADERKDLSNGKYVPFTISLRDVPVYSLAQVLGKDKILFQKDNPKVEGTKRDDCTIKSVVITEKNTQVKFSYTSGIYIYTGNFGNTFISAGGSQYPLVSAYGIATDKRQCFLYAGGSQQDFTLVFEALSKPVETIDIIFDDWRWEKVRLQDPVTTTKTNENK